MDRPFLAGLGVTVDIALPPGNIRDHLPMEGGFSLVAVVRAAGIPQPRHAKRWLHHALPLTERNASLQLARAILHPPDSSVNMLQHVEALEMESELPEAFAVMSAVAVLERHLRLLCLENGVHFQADPSKGRINRYVDELYRERVITLADTRVFGAMADIRNDAAHDWFESVPAGSGIRTLRTVRELIHKYPLADADADLAVRTQRP